MIEEERLTKRIREVSVIAKEYAKEGLRKQQIIFDLSQRAELAARTIEIMKAKIDEKSPNMQDGECIYQAALCQAKQEMNYEG